MLLSMMDATSIVRTLSCSAPEENSCKLSARIQPNVCQRWGLWLPNETQALEQRFWGAIGCQINLACICGLATGFGLALEALSDGWEGHGRVPSSRPLGRPANLSDLRSRLLGLPSDRWTTRTQILRRTPEPCFRSSGFLTVPLLALHSQETQVGTFISNLPGTVAIAHGIGVNGNSDIFINLQETSLVLRSAANFCFS